MVLTPIDIFICFLRKPDAATGDVLLKKVFLEISPMYRKALLPEFFFNKVTGLHFLQDDSVWLLLKSVIHMSHYWSWFWNRLLLKFPKKFSRKAVTEEYILKF